jgi:hypothetical protein
MSAPDRERAAPDPKRAALERRYRRLLRCYPPGHREVHREEMLGWLVVVLLGLTVRRRAVAVPLLGTLLFAVLVWPVAIASWRARVSRESRAVAK